MKTYDEYINEGFFDRLKYYSFRSIKHTFKINSSQIDASRFATRFDLSDIEGIEDFKDLTGFRCDIQNIKKLDPLKNSLRLNVLWCNRNKIKSLEPLKNLINLEWLKCCENQIVSLEPLENLINLKTLWCFNNELESFKGLPENIVYTDCYNNPLNNWQDDIDAFSRSYKMCSDGGKYWFDNEKRFDEIIDLIKINMI